MLLTGNYRCVQKDAARSIKDAVHSDIETSRAVYNWVCDLCVKLGASRDDLVPFEKYANAAQSLGRPSSAARALFAGAPNIERVDRLVQAIAAQKGLRNAVVDETVARGGRAARNQPKSRCLTPTAQHAFIGIFGGAQERRMAETSPAMTLMRA